MDGAGRRRELAFGDEIMGSLLLGLSHFFLSRPPSTHARQGNRALKDPPGVDLSRALPRGKDGCCIHEYYREAPPEVLAATRREIFGPPHHPKRKRHEVRRLSAVVPKT